MVGRRAQVQSHLHTEWLAVVEGAVAPPDNGSRLWILIDRWEQLLFELFTDAALCDAKGASELAWDFEADLSTRVDADGIQLTAKQIRTYMGKQDYVYGCIGLAPD